MKLILPVSLMTVQHTISKVETEIFKETFTSSTKVNWGNNAKKYHVHLTMNERHAQ